MSFPLNVRPEAEADLTEAYDWYEDRQAGLGQEFLGEVHAALRHIAENPLHHQMHYKDVRRILTRRFPYKIFFFIEDGRIEVIGVIHAKRHPRVWKRRV